MRTCTSAILAGLLLALAPGRSSAQKSDDSTATTAAQKKAAVDNWGLVSEAPHVLYETKHLLIVAPKAMEKRLKASGSLLEKYHDRARAALTDNPKSPLTYPGKITVYLFTQREDVTAFARRVEKRRPTSGESASFSAKDDLLHAAAAPGPAKGASVEARAGEQIAALLLVRKAGKDTPLPEWLVSGFGRATSYRLLPREKFVIEERRQARALASKRKPSDVWGGTVEAEEASALSGSLADFLAYGPGASRFVKLVEGFQPEEGMATKTAVQAMEAAKIKVANVEKVWKSWVHKPN